MAGTTDKQFDLGPTNDIAGVEIFAVGTWNGDTYNADDLDAMVSSFQETKDKLKPYLKLGHDSKQKMVQKNGFPAAGYIDNLYRVGNKLVADFVKVPKVIYELLKVGGYRRVSSELFVNMPIAGKVYKYLLKAVALLGGDTPAVQNLKDVLSLYASQEATAVYNEDAPTKIYDMDASPQKENTMTEIEKLNEQLAEANKKHAEAAVKIQELEGLTAKLKEFTEKLKASEEKMVALSAENNSLKADVKKYSEDKNKAEVNATLDKLTQDKKIVPAQREAIFSLLMDARGRETGERKYKLGDKEVSQEDLILHFVQSNAAGLNTGENSKTGSPHGKPGQGINEADALDAKVREWMEKNQGKSYKEGLVAISPEGVPNTGEPVKE